MAQSFAVFATLICQINSVFPSKDTKAAKSFAFASVCCFFCGTELWGVAQSSGFAPKSWHRALVCDTELCFCRLCNFDLPNKQRFFLQRHKSCKKLRFLRYSACAEFLDSLLWFCGTEPGEMVTLSVNILDNFTWNDGVKIFVWVWGGSYGGGQWIPCSGSGTTVNFDITDDLTAFLLVRCHKDTVAPDWDAAAGSAGEIYNKTNDITYSSGQTSYNGVSWGNP